MPNSQTKIAKFSFSFITNNNRNSEQNKKQSNKVNKKLIKPNTSPVQRNVCNYYLEFLLFKVYVANSMAKLEKVHTKPKKIQSNQFAKISRYLSHILMHTKDRTNHWFVWSILKWAPWICVLFTYVCECVAYKCTCCTCDVENRREHFLCIRSSITPIHSLNAHMRNDGSIVEMNLYSSAQTGLFMPLSVHHQWFFTLLLV